jgi:hypothetical protein
MEDYELVARMRKTGSIGLANEPVKTSARRWMKKGISENNAAQPVVPNCLLPWIL